MISDQTLLEQAKEAGTRLAGAERGVLLARADYHTAIRRLHLAGTPLRAIAHELGISHQRVQQVVSAAGGSWWQVWRRRGAARDPVCTWCERPPNEVAKLIAGPKIFICDGCVAAAEQAMRGGPQGDGRLTHVSGGTRSRCDFCRKRGNGKRSMVTGPRNVCSDCLRICRDILSSRVA